MSLRWSSSLTPQRGLTNAKLPFFYIKSQFAWRKSATKFLCVKTVINKVVRHSFTYLSMQKWLVGDIPFYVKIQPTLCTMLIFLSIFARSASALTASEKSSVNTTRKCTTCFAMSLRWIVYVDPKPPKGGSTMQSVWYIINNNLR